MRRACRNDVVRPQRPLARDLADLVACQIDEAVTEAAAARRRRRVSLPGSLATRRRSLHVDYRLARAV
jgi:hypothetical protein